MYPRVGGGLGLASCFRDSRTVAQIDIAFFLCVCRRARKTVAPGRGLVRLCYKCEDCVTELLFWIFC